ncbi:OB-fold-containig protein [uncultured Tenacibaculum sp.]|uniref:OB-fold-containig protein n=1 Tax=uncultured Tenacibaculum sp. TaxID=174713 RepID=UPI00261D0232|nr:OB-fold-containig protein [uncultured Tenacibaculum sp.]
MEELLNNAFSPVNATLSILLIILSLYWVLTILTGIDLDFFDVDFDVDSDVDIDADIDSKIDVDIPDNTATEGSEGFFIKFLKYFGFDELPFMFLISIIIVVMWFTSINLNHYLNFPTIIGFILLIPIFFLSLFVAKFLTKPLVRIYRMINHKGEKVIDFLGREGKITATVSGDKIGQLEIIVKGDPIKIYVKSNSGEAIKTGENAVVIDESKDLKYYIIKKLETIN